MEWNTNGMTVRIRGRHEPCNPVSQIKRTFLGEEPKMSVTLRAREEKEHTPSLWNRICKQDNSRIVVDRRTKTTAA